MSGIDLQCNGILHIQHREQHTTPTNNLAHLSWQHRDNTQLQLIIWLISYEVSQICPLEPVRHSSHFFWFHLLNNWKKCPSSSIDSRGSSKGPRIHSITLFYHSSSMVRLDGLYGILFWWHWCRRTIGRLRVCPPPLFVCVCTILFLLEFRMVWRINY